VGLRAEWSSGWAGVSLSSVLHSRRGAAVMTGLSLVGAALVVGAGGGIGSALVKTLLQRAGHEAVYGVSRAPAPAEVADDPAVHWLTCDNSRDSIRETASKIEAPASLQRVIICNGILHGEALQPEKALEHIDQHAMLSVFEANTVVPLQWLAALTGRLRESPGAVVAVLSARVGSIADNHKGGWYSYRASKAALNMLLKSAAIELARRAPEVKLMAFHPGTTDTALSRPFQKSVPPGKLFTPDFVAGRLLDLMDDARADGELDFLDWAGKPIPW